MYKVQLSCRGSTHAVRLRFRCWDDRGTGTLRMRYYLGSSPGERHGRSSTRKHVCHTARPPSTPRRTTTWRAAATVEVSPCEFLDRGVFLDGEDYERLTNMAQQARADRRQFLEHLILRAEAVWNFQPPLPPAPRPWWKLCGKDPQPELPAIVADLRDVA